MRLEFAKLDGLGNDFVFIDNLDSSIDISPEQASAVCDRHFGIGADGVILVNPSPRPECAAYMHYINSDGTLAQMCGNGVRCFAKYLVDRNIVNPAEGSFIADTLAGPKPISFTVDKEAHLVSATVDMGGPVLDPDLVPIDAKANNTTSDGVPFVGDLPITSPWGDFRFTAVSMGNPHAVCFIEDFSSLDDSVFTNPTEKSLSTLNVDMIGKFYESNPIFPEKSNIEFAVIEGDAISMRVYERGCAETLACGTGACATNVAAALTGRAGRANTVRLLGGDLFIDWDENNHVMMTGPAEQTFSGTIDID